MSKRESMDFIHSLEVFGSRPGLEHIGKLMDRLGNPQNRLHFIHVAGTNGKGSTVAMAASALTEAGYKTGRYISPYVIDFSERISIDGQHISDYDLERYTRKLIPVVKEFREQDCVITEFEFITALAFCYFSDKECDLVVLEVGLGGRFDATNIISTPLVSVIASIDLDHTAVLGNTLEEIAFEKCGIIKRNGTTVLYPQQHHAAMEVVYRRAAEENNHVIMPNPAGVRILSADIDGTRFTYGDLKVKTPFIGRHQVWNTITVIESLKVLRGKGYRITDAQMLAGIEKTFFPARMEVLNRSPLVILDGAHNPSAALVLRDTVQEYLKGKKLIGVMGVLKDKDFKTILSDTVPLFEQMITLRPDSPRALSPAVLAAYMEPFGKEVTVERSYISALKKAVEMAGEDGAVVIFGSLFLASKMRRCAHRYFKKN